MSAVPELGLIDLIACAVIERRLGNEIEELILALLEGTDAEVDAAMEKYHEWREMQERESRVDCPHCRDGSCGKCGGNGWRAA